MSQFGGINVNAIPRVESDNDSSLTAEILNYPRFRLSFRFQFGCVLPEESLGSCRTVGSPDSPPKPATTDCAIPIATVAISLNNGLRLHKQPPCEMGTAGQRDLTPPSRTVSATDTALTSSTAKKTGPVAVAHTVPFTGGGGVAC
jgi:hypothetical protein